MFVSWYILEGLATEEKQIRDDKRNTVRASVEKRWLTKCLVGVSYERDSTAQEEASQTAVID